MADDDTERPSLEAPRLFKRRRPASTSAPAPAPADETPAERTAVLQELDDTADGPGSEPTAGTSRRAPRRPRPSLPSLPRLSGEPPVQGAPAAALTGVVVGLALLAFTWLGFRGCEVARGTSSCGTGPGMAALLVVLVLAVVVGAFLLRWVRVPDPGATSFLGTGLTGVVCLLFLVDQLDHWSMVVVIPAIAALTFLASWWVTTTYIDPE
ncbi:hypothetical protein [Nocardioides litoris]|uniref:hypothetical protein n=1 Tax=Nocardioides litoris TaxID=1926648 RepID=UPI001120F89F|nr:hypothetical protein [Nocardioides litoris]